ncbi:MAG: type-F conjugative transfer system secretin TraK [Rickettsiales bacterium]|jgi:type-F conjugative transfer system secretin TraK|nr:type-F conjugative transfer system secretin TraK [Rickettsiales bacterium]
MAKNQYYSFSSLIYYVSIILITTTTLYAKDYSIQDNGELDVIISSSNVNRLKVFHDRITNIRTNADELKIDTDKATGELYLKPTGVNRNIDVFLKTENGYTYKLVLKVKDNISAQQVFINREEFTLNKYSEINLIRKETQSLIDNNLYFDFDTDYKLSAVNLMRAMSNTSKLQGWNIVKRDKQELLDIKGFDVEWLYSYVKSTANSNISGEITLITNTTDKSVELKEEMFLRRGIRAISVEKQLLQPKESCFMYMIGGDK